MAIREGAWDCPVCGTKGIPGSSKHCGGCGNARGDDVQFYLPEGAREVTEEEERRRAGAGPDWKCPYCNGENPGSNSHCSGCGSSADGTEKRATRVTLTNPPKPPAPEGPNWMKRILAGCCLLILLFFVGCWVLNQTTAMPLKVQSMSWQRSIDVEVLGMVTEEGWQDKGEVPSNARVLSRSRQVRETRQVQTGTVTKTRTVSEQVQTGTKKVKVGTKDMGNGYFEDVYEEQPVYENRERQETYQDPVYREEPIYDTKVRYEVEKWHKDSEATSSGSDNKPVWPTVQEGPKRRAGAKRETYKIGLSGERGSYTFEPKSEAGFTPFAQGQTVEGSVTRLGVVNEIHPK